MNLFCFMNKSFYLFRDINVIGSSGISGINGISCFTTKIFNKMLNINTYNFIKLSSTSIPKILPSTLIPDKLVVNSTPNNIIFIGNESILFLSPITNLKGLIILKDGVDVTDRDKLSDLDRKILEDQYQGKHLFVELENILSELEDDYYSFDFYFYIESYDGVLEILNLDQDDSYNDNYCFIKMVGNKGYIKISSIKFRLGEDRKSTRLNSSHLVISYAVFCLK